MTKNPYNGWFNYETWLFNLWHDDSFSGEAYEYYKASESDSTFTREENATFRLADHIKSLCEELYAPDENSFLSDITTASLQEINFHEIAKHYIDDLYKDIEAA